jgi:chemotaxis protein histidine kinase CheA
MTSRQDIIAYLYSKPNHRIADPEGRLNSGIRDTVAYQGSPRGMSQLLAALESEGMIKRTIKGRRCFVIELTSKGIQDGKSLPVFVPGAPRTDASDSTSTAKKAPSKKAAKKKSTAKKAPAKKAAAKKAPAKKTAAKKAPAKKTAAKKAPAKKAPAKKATVTKVTAKKAPAKKTAAKKAPAKKAAPAAKVVTLADAVAAAKTAAAKAASARGIATRTANAAAVKGASAQVKAAAKTAAAKASAAKSLATKAANAVERAKLAETNTAPSAAAKGVNFAPGNSNLKKLPAAVDSLARTLLDVTLERYTHLEELEQDVLDAQKARDEAVRIAKNLQAEIVELKAQAKLLQNNLDAVLQGPDKSVDIAIRSKRLALLLGGR